MSIPTTALSLRGRKSEREALDRLLANVRAGRSGVLVLRGEAGIGKTALLADVSARSSHCRIARAVGVESEMEMAFAGLQQLCAPMLDHLGRLPRPQRDALEVAFGLEPGEARNRFLVGLAVLTLLADVAQEQPLLCLVDDAQWLDLASAQTLAFVARRLQAERIAMLFATRDEPGGGVLAGLPELRLRGLSDDDTRALLGSALSGRLDERVRDRIVAETSGNPLALLELPQGLTVSELAGGFGLPNTASVPSLIESSFARRITLLPLPTQRLLLAAAAEPVGDVILLWGAAERLGITPDAAAPAESAGLLEVGARVRFRHPLVRSAVYRSAELSARRETHQALAEATDPDGDPDRRAWHRAHAAAGPDEAVAAALERSAERAEARGGIAAAAAFLEWATVLTPEPTRRGARALAAAHAKFGAGALAPAYELLATAELTPLDSLQQAQAARLRAQIVFARRRGSDATPLLLEAARQLLAIDSGLARETYLEALATAIFASRVGDEQGVRAAAEAALAAPPGPQPSRPIDLLLDGLATQCIKGHVAGVPMLRRALKAFRDEALSDQDAVMRWLWLACPVAQETAAHDLWDTEMWNVLATRAIRLARDTGALAVLPVALVYRAGVHLHAGEFNAASALIEEADAITAATGYAPVKYASLVLIAWRGEESAAVKLIDAAVNDATERGEGRVIGLAGYATAVLYNSLGRYEAALVGAQRACEYEDLGFFGWSLAELVEAGARTGADQVAARALRQLEARARTSGTDWALGILARAGALLSEGGAAESLHREAIARLAGSGVEIHLARAHLLYGEWLRREQRRVQAREQLHTAHEMFARMGAAGFAERARRELVATGETVRRGSLETPDALTAQETQIAHLAADGLTNREIGAEPFLSPHTVEWHLRKVFVKLSVKSRRQLRGAVPTFRTNT